MKGRWLRWILMPVTAAALNAEPAAPAGGDSGTVDFSFDQVDIRSFVKLVGDLTGRKFVVADTVAGKITVVSPRIKKTEIYPLFVSIIESSGCSIEEDNGLHRVVQAAPRTTPMSPVVGAKEATPLHGMITKIIRLSNVSAAEVRKALESKVGGGKAGGISAIEENNHLVITDTAEAVRRIEKIVAEIDQPGLARTLELVPLKFAGAEDLAQQLNLAMAEVASRGDQLKNRLPAVPGIPEYDRRQAAVVASPNGNNLILVGSASQIDELRRLIAKMDTDMPSGRGRLNAIFLKYLSAEEAAKSLNLLLTKNMEKDKKGEPTRKIAVEASVANNAILVDSSVGDFDAVKKLIEQLDTVPEQVHIEVMIAEVSDAESLNLGVEMAALDIPKKAGDTAIQGASRLGDGTETLLNNIQSGIIPRGLTVGVAHGAYTDSKGVLVSGYPGFVNIDALIKTGKFKIESTTSLEAQDNKEASFNIVNEIPILKSTISAGTGTTRDIIQNIDRVTVGIKLKLTPHVISGKEVRMVLNPSIEAVTDPGPAGTQFAPTIARRDVTTTVTVENGRQIVIAGLTRKDKNKTVRRVPILGSIPLVGWLFRYTSESEERTNLLIFVTPRIVTGAAATDEVSREWKKKTDLKAHE